MVDPTIMFILALVALAFLLVTLVLYALAFQAESAIARHDLIRAARQQRNAYLQTVADRRKSVNADYDNAAAAAEEFDEPPADALPFPQEAATQAAA